MSLPRRQSTAFQRTWSPGRSSSMLVFFWTMIFWGATQAALSLANAIGGAACLTVGNGVAVVGFSAAVAAVLSAYATIMPELETGISFFHLFPLRFRAKYLAFAMVIFAAGCVATGTVGEIGPAG